MEIPVPPDVLVHSFLKQAKTDGWNAIVAYVVAEGGKAFLRLSSNHDDPKAVANLWNWIMRTDENVVEACARGIHEREEGCFICTAMHAVQLSKPVPGWTFSKTLPWSTVRDHDKERHREITGIVLEIAKALAGRTLNVAPV